MLSGANFMLVLTDLRVPDLGRDQKMMLRLPDLGTGDVLSQCISIYVVSRTGTRFVRSVTVLEPKTSSRL